MKFFFKNPKPFHNQDFKKTMLLQKILLMPISLNKKTFSL
ncbi:hypothetical protein RCH33_2372 [Flavobacterium daejeonense]|nr:hypothetical protein RCH33_2372 [Flavobacterium daejeonense]